MIDSHCHLEQKDYEKDLDEVMEKCKKAGLKAVITSCANPKDFQRTLDILEKHKGFVFVTVGIHPQYVKELSDEDIDALIDKIKENDDRIVGIGEVGLDYAWIKEPEFREKQKELFIKFIKLSKELNKPLVIHAREALEETLTILDEQNASDVMLHMWGGHNLMDKVNALGYYVSMNSIIMRSKSYRKVVKKIPLNKLMLETDAPWMAVKEAEDGYVIDTKARNDSTTIKLTAEKIAELRNIKFDEIWEQCGKNSVLFFKLPLNI